MIDFTELYKELKYMKNNNIPMPNNILVSDKKDFLVSDWKYMTEKQKKKYTK